MKARSILIAGALVGGLATADDAGSAARIWSIEIPPGWAEIPVPLPPGVQREQQRMEKLGGGIDLLGYKGPDAALQLQRFDEPRLGQFSEAAGGADDVSPEERTGRAVGRIAFYVLAAGIVGWYVLRDLVKKKQKKPAA